MARQIIAVHKFFSGNFSRQVSCLLFRTCHGSRFLCWRKQRPGPSESISDSAGDLCSALPVGAWSVEEVSSQGADCNCDGWRIYEGVSENVVYPIVPNGFADHYPVFKWLFHWEYTQHFQTNPWTKLWSLDLLESWQKLSDENASSCSGALSRFVKSSITWSLSKDAVYPANASGDNDDTLW